MPLKILINNLLIRLSSKEFINCQKLYKTLMIVESMNTKIKQKILKELKTIKSDLAILKNTWSMQTPF